MSKNKTSSSNNSSCCPAVEKVKQLERILGTLENHTFDMDVSKKKNV